MVFVAGNQPLVSPRECQIVKSAGRLGLDGCAVADLLVDVNGATTIKPNSNAIIEQRPLPYNNTGCETEIKKSASPLHTEFPPWLASFSLL